MNFIEAFGNKNILIPLLQRDYVQGSVESVITPFIEQLIDKDKHSDLNYIYGYDEKGMFVPIDGQQRLITLWLLHLYCAAKSHSEFNVRLQFMSREFANDFSEKLSENLAGLLNKMKDDKTELLDKIIVNQSWFISSWQRNETVRGMLNTLSYIQRKCSGIDVNDLWKQLNSENCHITFSFLNMGDEQGLDDDIYIKMNGRGRPLSVFENLKSWMDEKVKKEPEEWANKWALLMDNEWTDLFWENRNREQEHPEEIDDEQLYCFCNLLILYWMKNKDKLQEKLKSIKDKELYLYEDLLRLLKKGNVADDIETIISYLFEQLQKGELPPLVWIERLEFMPAEFLRFTFDSLNTLHDLYLSNAINGSEVYIGKIKDGQTKTNYLSMSEGTFGRTLPLLYAILLGNAAKNLHDWLRVCRNLIENTHIGQAELPNILNNLDNFYAYVKDKDLFKILTFDDETDKLLSNFSSSQVKEEREKAKLPLEFRTTIEKLENHPFFFGRIGIVFKVLENSNDIGELNKFKKCTAVLSTIFSDENTKGVREIFDKEDEYLLRRALMCFPPHHYYGYWKGNDWCFCNNREEWKVFLDTSRTEFIDSFKQLVNNCIERLHSIEYNAEMTCKDYMKEIIAETERDYENKLNEQDGKDKFYLHFVHYPGVWKYMQQKICKWEDNYSIMLKRNKQANEMNLRTYTLYLTYLRKDFIKNGEFWKCYIYEREGSNFTLERRIAIEIFHNGEKEDGYGLRLLIHSTGGEDDEKLSENEQYLSQFVSSLQISELKIVAKDGRYETSECYSREKIISFIDYLVKTIDQEVSER